MKTLRLVLLAVLAVSATPVFANGEPGYEALKKNPTDKDDREWNGQGDPKRPDCWLIAMKNGINPEGWCEHWGDSMNRKWSH